MASLNVLERAKAHQEHEEKIRQQIRAGNTRKAGDYYAIEMDGALWYYGAEYVERVIEWGDRWGGTSTKTAAD